MERCVNCGKEIKPDSPDAVRYHDDVFCSEFCANSCDVATCEKCGYVGRDWEMIGFLDSSNKGHAFCGYECALDSGFVLCHHCDEWTEADCYHMDDFGEYYCPECYMEHTAECEYCGSLMDDSEVNYYDVCGESNQEAICDECVSSEFFKCEQCGQLQLYTTTFFKEQTKCNSCCKADASMMREAVRDSLKPCPFCGNEADVCLTHEDDGFYNATVYCLCCNASITVFDLVGASAVEKAGNEWNRRVEND